MIKKALTIAGSDSGGGAGIQADLKTFSALGVYGMSVITAVTAQNTRGVLAVEDISAEVVTKQLDAVFSDIQVDAVKIGMVSNAETIKAIAGGLEKWKAKGVVLDPVMVSETGSLLLEKEAVSILVEYLFPLAAIITPNLYEASVLLKREINTVEEMEEAAAELYYLGSSPVLLTGGHLGDNRDVSNQDGDKGGSVAARAIDVYFDGKSLKRYEAERIETRNTHGTGCTYSSAIAAYLARGFGLEEAIGKAKNYITGAIRQGLDIGHGPGPVNHFHQFWP